MSMKKYENLHGNSGVSEYLPLLDSIKIRFRDDRRTYVYSYSVTGKHHVDEMKSLAEAGRGLATYVARHKDMLNFSTESL